MVQDSLVDYISSQLKLGVSREAVKSALINTGWVAADVEETIKKVEASGKPAAPVMAPSASPTAMPSSSMGMKPSGSPNSIKVSDLVSASGSAVSFSSPASGMKTATAAAVKDIKPVKMETAKTASMSAGMSMAMPAGEKKRFGITTIAGIVIIVLLAGGCGYLFYQNMNLTSQASSLGQASAGTAAQITSLNATVAALNASNTAYAAQVASLASENTALQTSLGFLIVPQGSTTTVETVTVHGALSGNAKSSFVLTTPYGVNVTVKNTKDAKVSALLTPLVGNKDVDLTGTHAPGSQSFTVTAVNGAAVESVAPAATSTATTTATASSSAQ